MNKDKIIYKYSHLADGSQCPAYHYQSWCRDGDNWTCDIDKEWICNETCIYKGKILELSISLKESEE